MLTDNEYTTLQKANVCGPIGVEKANLTHEENAAADSMALRGLVERWADQSVHITRLGERMLQAERATRRFT